MSKIETGQAADAAQDLRAQAGADRPATEFAMSGISDFVARARDGWTRKRLAVLESDCPECAIDSASGRSCAFRGQEICKHAAEVQSRARARTLQANMSVGKVPAPYWTKIAAGKYDDTAAVAAARRIAAEEGKFAILAGGVGGGKTFGLALAIAERGGLFVPAASLDPFGREVNELIEQCMVVPLLALDDAAAGRSTSDVARARIEQIVCARWDGGRATMMSSNLTQAEFWPLHGGPLGRVADRLHSDPIGWVRCLEDSKRAAPTSFNERGEKP